MRFSSTKFPKSLFFIILVVGSVALFFLVFYRPVMGAIDGLKSEIMQVQKRNSEEQAVTQVLSDKNHSVKELRQEVDQLKAGLLQPNEYSPLMRGLRDLSNRFSFVNESIALKGQEKRPGYSAVLLEIKIQGTFEEMYRYLLGLEELDIVVQVDRIRMESGSGKEASLAALIQVSAPLQTQ